MLSILADMMRRGSRVGSHAHPRAMHHPGDWRPPAHWRAPNVPQGYPDHHADRPLPERRVRHD